MEIDRLDHLVLTVRNLEESCLFYEKVLGMRREMFGEGRIALNFGRQKINLHPDPSPYEPKAKAPMAGSADLCFVVDLAIDTVVAHLKSLEIAIEEGPVARSGAVGPITSVYVRDPDGNLIEIATYT